MHIYWIFIRHSSFTFPQIILSRLINFYLFLLSNNSFQSILMDVDRDHFSLTILLKHGLSKPVEVFFRYNSREYKDKVILTSMNMFLDLFITQNVQSILFSFQNSTIFYLILLFNHLIISWTIGCSSRFLICVSC